MNQKHVQTFTWYDTETSGINHEFDQIYQFASVKTDADLNIIPNSEKNLLCKPRLDVIPQPGAFLTHMIDIDELKQGMSELELSNIIANEFLSNPANMISGYNTISFDDEIVRRLMFRNMRDPYVHEWTESNGRFDLYKMVQMVYALRPEMLTWRKNDKNADSLKLEHLIEDNNLLDIGHKAHDALSDVYATISLARHLKEQNPDLFNYMLKLTMKQNVNEILFGEYDISKRSPVIDINTIYGQAKRYSSVVLPIIGDLKNKSKVLCVDLTKDPTDLFGMSPQDINKYLFTKREELEAHAPRVPAVGISVNKMPVILKMGPNTLSQDRADSMDIDLEQIEENRRRVVEFINKDPKFIQRLQQGFNSEHKDSANRDAYSSIYTGFFNDNDKNVRGRLLLKDSVKDNSAYLIKSCDVYEEANKSSNKQLQFDLILRAKWTNHFREILTEGGYSSLEFSKWLEFVNDSLFSGEKGGTFEEFYSEIARYKTEKALNPKEIEILKKVEHHVEEMKRVLGILEKTNDKIQDNINLEKQSNKHIQRFERLMSKSNEKEASGFEC